MQIEGPMRHMSQVRTMACVLVAVTLLVTLLGGSACAASADNRRKIVMFNNSSYPLVLGGGITVLYNLALINALAVELPALGTDAALALLQGLPGVQQIS